MPFRMPKILTFLLPNGIPMSCTPEVYPLLCVVFPWITCTIVELPSVRGRRTSRPRRSSPSHARCNAWSTSASPPTVATNTRSTSWTGWTGSSTACCKKSKCYFCSIFLGIVDVSTIVPKPSLNCLFVIWRVWCSNSDSRRPGCTPP
jgi:hypothetical protein